MTSLGRLSELSEDAEITLKWYECVISVSGLEIVRFRLSPLPPGLSQAGLIQLASCVSACRLVLTLVDVEADLRWIRRITPSAP
jgi:hypothetical protein